MKLKSLLILLFASSLFGQTNLASTQNCPCSLMGNLSPIKTTSGADKPVEVGTRFFSDINSNVIGLRFYKMTGASGVHTGNLWDVTTATLLASVQYLNETPSGWQAQNLPAPIPIVAGHIYISSYHTDTGYEALDQNFFVQNYDSPPLHAAGGVYAYGASRYPNISVKTNYYSDVVLGSYVSLTWTPSTSPSVLYNIFRSTTSGGQDLLSPIASGLKTTNYIDINVVSGVRYYYKATATLQSIPSNEIFLVIP